MAESMTSEMCDKVHRAERETRAAQFLRVDTGISNLTTRIDKVKTDTREISLCLTLLREQVTQLAVTLDQFNVSFEVKLKDAQSVKIPIVRLIVIILALLASMAGVNIGLDKLLAP